MDNFVGSLPNLTKVVGDLDSCRHSETNYGWGYAMQNETKAGNDFPRLGDLPRCSACADVLVAAEASVLDLHGRVSHLWTCDSCGQSLITAGTLPLSAAA